MTVNVDGNGGIEEMDMEFARLGTSSDVGRRRKGLEGEATERMELLEDMETALRTSACSSLSAVVVVGIPVHGLNFLTFIYFSTLL